MQLAAMDLYPRKSEGVGSSCASGSCEAASTFFVPESRSFDIQRICDLVLNCDVRQSSHSCEIRCLSPYLYTILHQ